MSKKHSRAVAALAASDLVHRTESADIPVAPLDAADWPLNDRSVLSPSDATPAPRETATPVTHEEIAERAYSYWQSRGCQGGSAEDDWQRALTEIMRERQTA